MSNPCWLIFWKRFNIKCPQAHNIWKTSFPYWKFNRHHKKGSFVEHFKLTSSAGERKFVAIKMHAYNKKDTIWFCTEHWRVLGFLGILFMGRDSRHPPLGDKITYISPLSCKVSRVGCQGISKKNLCNKFWYNVPMVHPFAREKGLHWRCYVDVFIR